MLKNTDMNIGRAKHGMIKCDHKVFVFGSTGDIKSAERYDIIKNSWKNLPDMPTAGEAIS